MQTDKVRKDGPARSGKRKTIFYDVSQVGERYDALRSSDKRPLDGTIYAMRDRIVESLADGYSITDVIEMLQQAGIDGTDRQIRYAMARAGIHRRHVRRGRTGAVRRQATQAGADSRTADRGFGDAEIVQETAVRAMNAVQNSDERSAGEPQVPSSVDSGNGQASSSSSPAAPQVPSSSDGCNTQDNDAHIPFVPQTPSKGAMNDGQAGQTLTPEEADELADFDRAGADEY